MVEGVGFTDNVLVTKQPVEVLTTVIVVVPVDIPLAAPEDALICATVVSLELHTRVPEVAEVSTTKDPTQTEVGPEIVEGAGLIPISFV